MIIIRAALVAILMCCATAAYAQYADVIPGTPPLPLSNGNGGTGSGTAGSGLAFVNGVLVTRGQSQVLCSIRAANFNTLSDQTCVISTTITAWVPTGISGTNCSTSLTVAVGGVYPAASKGGTALVGALQVYTALTVGTIVLPLTLAIGVGTTRYAINTTYLSLSLAQGSAATCDLYLIGIDLT